ncbi:SMI1/KNR4 family protein [Clostridium gasigenes]|uniref:SMI1 / KNR4 family (SUKH-1) n=1 Tax=Clostridium gasigenes TaxID=94869 RepID=A0A1H0QH28_9CLOT|nr:SMI1/KNR4 family protein [Clostridium gasigenes]MBB6624502.1 SMI1/KNR4 family protein [Clostridium gasigenes]SDP16375.1 SMI1 / KNR4 family (SUKH-1) [Clostridium gasigenes]
MIKLDNLNYALREPAKLDEIKKVEIALGYKLPKVYRNLLQMSNGLSVENGMEIFDTELLVEMNIEYKVSKYASGYIAIASNGGGKFILMAADESDLAILQVDSGVLNPKYSTLVNESFIEWINDGAKDSDWEDEEDEEEQDLGRVILIEPPKNGSSDLRIIEKVFDIQYLAFEILKGYKDVPFVLIEDVEIDEALEKIKSLGELGKLLKVEKIMNKI